MTIHDIPDECLRRGAQRQGVNMTKLTERHLIERVQDNLKQMMSEHHRAI